MGNNTNPPCEFDHNGECLICDCWPTECAYDRYLNKDYRYETEEELKEMFDRLPRCTSDDMFVLETCKLVEPQPKKQKPEELI